MRLKFSLQEITTAYRKAKADAWLRHDLNEDEYVQYENSFLKNILSFKRFMESFPNGEFTSDWLGGWRLMAKKITMRASDREEDMSLSSDSNENFSSSKVEEIAYRLIASPSVSFQILSSLWILRVGWKYEKILHRTVYGNRLRPLDKITGRPSVLTRGSFQFYRPMFTKWKRDGIESLRSVLKKLKGGRAIVVSADAKAFFHSLKPDFLLDEKYLHKKDIMLTQEDRLLTRLLIDAINVWATTTPLKTGLPVGLAASSVIANVALVDFDASLENIAGGVFYGRYVDDILLVFRNRNVRTRSDVWNCVARTSEAFRPYLRSRESHKTLEGTKVVIGIEFDPEYKNSLTTSKIVFTGEKCRAFFLDDKTGPSFVETLTNQIQEVTSEFRYLPHNIFDKEDIEYKIQKLLTKDGEEADNFRKIEALSLRKKDFEELLREMRFLLKTLPLQSWKQQRTAFYRLVDRHLMTPMSLTEYAVRVFPQIISLAVLCGDFTDLITFICRVEKTCETMVRVPSVIAGGVDVPVTQEIIGHKWREELFSLYARSVKTSFRDIEEEVYNKGYLSFVGTCWDCFAGIRPAQTLLVAKTWTRQYILHDLAAHSYIEHLYRAGIRPLTCQATTWKCSSLGFVDVAKGFDECFDKKYLDAAVSFGQHTAWPMTIRRSSIPYALLFPTRPIAERDLTWLNNGPIRQKVEDVFLQLRGYVLGSRAPERIEGRDISIKVKNVENRHIVNPIVALLNIKTDDVFCCEHLKVKAIDPSLYFSRLKDIIKVINVVISQKIRVDYLVIHELALPLRWFLAISGHCAEYGMSLMAGLTYNVTDLKKKLCKNEVGMSLVRTGSGAFRQPEFLLEAKKAFAYEEAYNLNKKYGFRIDNRLSDQWHMIIRHGSFAFSVLICSELTEILNRSRLRGLIDALFVIEWNQDVRGFSAIVESTANDLHAYVVQSNNNRYGDNRIRVPRKKEWERDIVRLRGGEGEFCVIGKIDVVSLRDFQIHWDPKKYFAPGADPAFKPIPIGYKDDIPNYRQEIPKRNGI